MDAAELLTLTQIIEDFADHEYIDDPDCICDDPLAAPVPNCFFHGEHGILAESK